MVLSRREPDFQRFVDADLETHIRMPVRCSFSLNNRESSQLSTALVSVRLKRFREPHAGVTIRMLLHGRMLARFPQGLTTLLTASQAAPLDGCMTGLTRTGTERLTERNGLCSGTRTAAIQRWSTASSEVNSGCIQWARFA